MYIAWDEPANMVFRNLPANITLRVAVYELCERYGYGTIAERIAQHYPGTTMCTLKQATQRLADGHVFFCPRCGRPTTSTRLCSTCTQSARDGIMTEREWGRLKQHYAEAHEQYGNNREPVLIDNYTR